MSVFKNDHWSDIYVISESDDESEKQRKKRSKTKFQKSESCYCCYLCCCRCSNREDILKHMGRKHTYITKERFLCCFCRELFDTEENIASHLLIHLPAKETVNIQWRGQFIWGFMPREEKKIKRKRFSKEELKLLKEEFQKNPFLEKRQLRELSRQMQVAWTRVTKWFENQRKIHQH